MTAADEQLLILQVKQGSHPAFRELMDQHMRKAYNVAYGFVNDADSAHDITQDAFIRAYEGIGNFRGEAGFGTWLYRIVVNLSMNHLKRQRSRERREVTLNDTIPLAADPDPAQDGSQDLRSHIERAIHELPTLQRAVVILRHLDGLSTKQVSEILKVSEGTVKTHLFRGLKKLKERLEDVRLETL